MLVPCGAAPSEDVASAPDLRAELEAGEAGLLGDLARGAQPNVLAVLETAAGRDPERPAGLGHVHAKQQQAILVVEEEDPHCVSDAETGRHAPGR